MYTPPAPTLLPLGRFALPLHQRCLIMGILNITTDSFSGDGLLTTPEAILAAARDMAANGAEILDIGGETAGTSRTPISVQEEIDRTAPWIEVISREIDIPVSINSWRFEVAQAALQAGAVLINDIGGLADPRLATLAADNHAGLVIMHLRGKPKEPHLQEEYVDVIQEMIRFFEDRIALATSLGLPPHRIILDPGIDFAKQPRHNLEILRRMPELTTALPHPWLAAVSRKTILGDILDQQPAAQRDPGTVALVTASILGGCHIVRVHNVPAMSDVVRTIHRLYP